MSHPTGRHPSCSLKKLEESYNIYIHIYNIMYNILKKSVYT